MEIVIAGSGLAAPPGRVDQSAAAQHAVEMWGEAAGLTDGLRGLYRRSGVKTRHSVLLEGEDPLQPLQSFYRPARGPDDGGPTTRDRMSRYEQDASDLAARAAGDAIADAEIEPRSITHLVTASCSGFDAPGVDVALIEKLKLSRDVARTHVGFMGCHAAFNAMRVARAFAATDASACVLVCCVELCSLHQQYAREAQGIVANALFADGAAGLVVRQSSDNDRGWRLLQQRSCVLPETADLMSWRIGDHGFMMTLSPRVPEVIQKHLRPWLGEWLPSLNLSVDTVDAWAIHPGGPRILSACQEALGLPPEALADSRAILADYGNMSSPTVLFILDRIRRRAEPKACVALAFGPGLTIEAALFSASAPDGHVE